MSSVGESLGDENQIRQAQARDALARWVCSSKVSPLKLLNPNGPFKEFSDSLNPNFHQTLSYKSLREDCLKIYKEQLVKAKEILLNLDGRISISVDERVFEKSGGDFVSHYCISAHFIDNDWKLKKWVIRYCSGDYDNIASVKTALNVWNIESKLVSLTGVTDMGDIVKADLQARNELVLNGQLFPVKCSCDVITKMAQSGFKLIKDVIDKAELLAWSKSLPLWYLTTCKLQNVLELEGLGEFTPDNVDESFYELPSAEEWSKMRSICRITDRIYEITKPVYEAKKLTSNLFLPHLVEIHSYLVQESASSDEFVKEVTKKMLEIYTEYWNDMYLMLSIAAFLDPRYKMKLVEFSLSKLQCSEKASIVLETIRKLYDLCKVKNAENEYLLSESESGEDEEMFEQMFGQMIEEKQAENVIDKLNILKEYTLLRPDTESDQLIKSDLECYLEEPVLAWTENFSVLHWWKDNCSKYPRLSRMARDFLAVPLSVASSTEAYYTEPRPAEHTVAYLKPLLLNALMCTRSWNLGFPDKTDN